MHHHAIRFVAPKGWRHEGWRSCQDLRVPELQGVPRWFRCCRCDGLVTHGMVAIGGCTCGNRKIMAAQRLSWWEIITLKVGLYDLDTREYADVQPLLDCVVRKP